MNTNLALRFIIAILFACSICKFEAVAETPQVSSQHSVEMQKGLVLFKKSVRKTLIDNCVKCHNSTSKKADFDLSTRKALLSSGHADRPADQSYLVQVIRHEEEPFMPHKAEKLHPKQIAGITKWLDLGAPYDAPLVEIANGAITQSSGITNADRQFWSFLPLASELPDVEDSWCGNDIDRFVLHKLQSKNLRPQKQATKRQLIRRAYFDLIGLPPTPEEVRSFEADEDADSYERMIDRLLDSKHYGERWARHWLDVARFAESSGFEHDDDRPNAYHFRDFVIKALNDDLPFNEFVRWQIAGDEIAPHNPLAMSATGFLGAGVFPTQLTEVEFESARYDELDDMVSSTSLAFLGLSVGCARCHDHKFDPIPSRDYYQMVATFASTVRSEVKLSLEPASKPVKVQITADGFAPMKNHADGRGYPHYYKNVYFLNRGDVAQKQSVVDQGFLHVLMRNSDGTSHWKQAPPTNWNRSQFRRTALANWITDPTDGAGQLLARVIANRLWQHHFGQGIVTTPNDFGMQGERPTHPKLLDWLASELIRGGWKLKSIHRLIMMSNVYRQGNDINEVAAKIDPKNRLYWRRTPRRLEAEAIRDSCLSISGLLDKTMFGRGTLNESSLRRSIYFTIKRSKLIPSMMLFDWPEHLVSIGQRASTTTAPQALLFLNSEMGRKYASGFAKQLHPLVRGDTKKNEERDYRPAIQYAYESAFGRIPSDREVQISLRFISDSVESNEKPNDETSELGALTDFCHAMLAANEFIYIP